VGPARPIVTLSAETTARIAAGEVIERPISVIRELIDNALDAGATHIVVELHAGGRETIQVSDDGHGIPSDQVELAFSRHATSKIATAADLSRLETLGFRGEALPSIAAVSEVTMVTSSGEDGVATLLTRQGDTTSALRVAARQRGTTVTVRHLFRDVPARRKLISRTGSESTLALQLLRRYALAHPGVRFELLIDGRKAFHSSGLGSLDRAVADVYGPHAAQALLTLTETVLGDAIISGYVGGQSATRPTRESISLVVNRRCASNGPILGALEAGYRPLLPRGRHPIAVVVIRVPPSALDPNVHPSKAEVRLLDELAIADALKQSVRELLGRAALRPASRDDGVHLTAQYSLPAVAGGVREPRGLAWAASEAGTGVETGVLARARIIDQVHSTLILAETSAGLLLVDQHRAHERVLFERLRQAGGSRASEAQSLLDPIVLDLTPARAAKLDERRAELEALGFYCERFGHREFLVRAVPAGATSFSEATSIREAVEEIVEEATTATEGWHDRLLVALACRTALRRGSQLQLAEMEELLQQLARNSTPAVCPHGSPLVLELAGGYLRHQFRW
jgi:DNA mismatch repair protein MutL